MFYDEPQWWTLTITAAEGGSALSPGEGHVPSLSTAKWSLIEVAPLPTRRTPSLTGVASAVEAGKVTDPSAQKDDGPGR